MDPHSFIARAEAQRWLGIAEKLLMGHDLVGAKTFAIRARESDPRLEGADQILAIADTLLAAEKRVVGNSGTQQSDYYAILQLVRFVQDSEHIADQYRRLAVTLNPHQNRFPYSDQAFHLVNDAWAVLSNPLRKSMYDGELDFTQEMNHIGFNLEQHHHHHHHQQHPHEHQHQHQQQQQHQHNFFSINRMGSSGHEQELVEQQPTFQTKVQRSHQQHNFLSQPNTLRPSPVREQEHLFQQREQEELFQPQVQPFQITSTPQQQSRPPPQPSHPQPSMRSSTPSPTVASPQHPLSWPQAPPQPPMRSTTSPSPPPPPAASPQPPVFWPQPPPHSQPQPRVRSMTPPPPPEAPPQPPVSWPQAPPHPPPQPSYLQQQSQPQQHQHFQPQTEVEPQRQQPPQEEQHHQQQESPEENTTPVQPPTQIDTNNSVSEEEQENADSENVDASPTFWTACPYCLYMYEYPRVYAECTLRCSNCERAFQAVPVPSPPPIIEDKEAYFCCWGSFPIGLSISQLEKKNGKSRNHNWTKITPLYDVSSQVHDHLDHSTPPKQNRDRGTPIYSDDVTDDIFTGISEPSDDSDLDWKGTNSNNKKKMKKMKKRGRKRKSKLVAGKKTNKNLQNSTESSKKPLDRRRRVAKELGKLDLNVEFNNNEGEEPASKMSGANRGHEKGEEDHIEGNGFFEGLDDFLSSLPILSVVDEEKGKAS